MSEPRDGYWATAASAQRPEDPDETRRWEEEKPPTRGSTADYCCEDPHEGHSYVHHKPAGSSLFVKVCTRCDFIDGEDLERQVAERLGGADRPADDDGRAAVPRRVFLAALNDKLLAAGVLADSEQQPRRVPDLPCPKCGSDDVWLRWAKVGGCGCEECRTTGPEHFDRQCRRCDYDWVTTDMLDANETGKSVDPLPTVGEIRLAAGNSVVTSLAEAGVSLPSDVLECVVRAAVDSTLYLVTDMLDAEEVGQ